MANNYDFLDSKGLETLVRNIDNKYSTKDSLNLEKSERIEVDAGLDLRIKALEGGGAGDSILVYDSKELFPEIDPSDPTKIPFNKLYVARDTGKMYQYRLSSKSYEFVGEDARLVEKERAESAELLIVDELDKEESRSIKKDEELEADITDLNTKHTELSGKLEAESSERKSADESLDAQLSSVSGRLEVVEGKTKLSDFEDDLGNSPLHSHNQYSKIEDIVDSIEEEKSKEVVYKPISANQAYLLDRRVFALETGGAGELRNVYLDGKTVVNPETKIAEIKSEDIKTLNKLDSTEDPGDTYKLYKTDDNKVYHFYYTKEGETLVPHWSEIGGADATLRKEFEAHLIAEYPHESIQKQLQKKASTEIVNSHLDNVNNPHQVNKLQVGLGNVDNTADLDKPVSNATQLKLDEKVNKDLYDTEIALRVTYSDIKDDLTTTLEGYALSAHQGVVLDEKIAKINSKIQSFGSALLFKGVVPSVKDLDNIVDKNIGDCYQINSRLNSTSNDDSYDGAMFAWDGKSWVEIVASATDLSAIMATNAEIQAIIDNYV